MQWTGVLVHPLGLVGIALALVFGVLGLKFKGRERPWFLPAAMILAGMVMVGGLYLAYTQIQQTIIAESEGKKVGSSTAVPKGESSNGKVPPVEVHQETHGPGSPAVQGVTGNVTIQQGQEKEKK